MIVPGSASPLLLSSAGGYNLTNSLRFRSSATAYLNRTPAIASNRRTWTWSAWVKRSELSSNQSLFAVNDNGNDYQEFRFQDSNTLRLILDASANNYAVEVPTVVWRDVSAWYHIVLAVDTTQATSTNRVKIYVNGIQQTVSALSGFSFPAPNFDTYVNATLPHAIGNFNYNNSAYFNGYMTEINFVNAQQLTPSSFGETSTTTGVWIPKKFVGTYGTNGFYLKFTDTTSTSTLGTDFSGNSNTWTVNNISLTAGSTYDSMTDVPTLTSITTANYCTWSPINRRTTVQIKDTLDGNLNVSGQSNQTGIIYATIYPTTGKWYFEFSPANTYANSYIGIGANNCEGQNQYPGNSTNSVGLEIGSGNVYSSSLLATYTGISAGEIGMIAWDCATGKVWMGRQGAWFNSGNPAAGTGQVATLATGENGAMVTPYSSSGVISSTFGQRQFSYTPPTGFLQLNTFNLPTPTIGATAATLANEYMDVTLWPGNSGTQSITNSGSMQPDLVWIKNRTGANNHALFDSVRGATLRLYPDTTLDEQTETTTLTAFNSNGFSLGSAPAVNASANDYVGWQWKANGTGVTNTAGSITSTVSANTTAGFSIVAYTGNGTNGATVGHGLGVKPFLIIEKGRTSTFAWSVQGCGELWTPVTSNLFLDNTNGLNASGAVAAPTSTVYTPSVTNYANESGITNIAYCFAPIAGYSAFGDYVGNDLNDGTFIYTGFRPVFVLYKKLGTDGWAIYDAKRNSYNVADAILQPDNNGAEAISAPGSIDIVSNGFKQRNSNNFGNSSSFTYIYMAFAETPFKYANAR